MTGIRISTRDDDPGLETFLKLQAEGRDITVFLDNRDVSSICDLADENTGEVRLAVLDEDGLLQIDDDGSILTETVTGDVKIVIV